MPFITYHLVEDSLEESDSHTLLLEGAKLYADVLEAPIERIRGLVSTYPPGQALVSGKIVGAEQQAAPYFEFIVMAGRSEEQITRLMKGFTDLLEKTLKVDRKLIRGRCIRVDPNDWVIAGESAAKIRANEIAERQKK